MPDFSEAAKASEFQEAIKEVAEICRTRPKPLSGEGLSGCVTFRVSSEQANKILADHHERFLLRGCYLVRHQRGYTSGKDQLALLPTKDWRIVLRAFHTNGANCGVHTEGIIAWLDKLGQEQPFLLTGAGFDWCEGSFTKPIVNSRQLAQRMYEFCPDMVDQGTGDVAQLANEIMKTQKFVFWWD